MKKLLFLLLSSLLLCACEHQIVRYDNGEPVPDYLVSIHDSFLPDDAQRSIYFYVKAIDGVAGDNAKHLAQHARYGNMQGLSNQGYRHNLPTGRTVTLTLAASRLKTAGGLKPAEERLLEGDLRFTPKGGTIYQVRGIINDQYQAVWLESSNGEIVAQIERIAGGAPTAAQPAASDYTGLDINEHFIRILGGETPQLVKAKFGEPDMQNRTASRRDVNTGRLTYNYLNLGSVHFLEDYQRGIAFSNRVDPEFERLELATVLQAANPALMRQYARWYTSSGAMHPDELDQLAQYSWMHRNSDNEQQIDANALICKLLGRQATDRYRTVLQRIADSSHSEKLQRYALASLEKLPAQAGQQFIPAD